MTFTSMTFNVLIARPLNTFKINMSKEPFRDKYFTNDINLIKMSKCNVKSKMPHAFIIHTFT
jgi:hypothetical protein